MGLLDDVLGAALGGGSAQPAGQKSGGMSPMMIAMLALIAYKALKSGNTGTAQTPAPSPAPSGGGLGGGLGDIIGGLLRGGGGGGLGDIIGKLGQAGAGGGLGDILKGPLGNVLAGGAAGGALSGGLNDILKQLQASGHGEVVKSWVDTGPNKPISPKDLEDALGHDTMKSLAEQAGLSQVEFASGLAQGLPHMVDKLTPQGRVPTPEETTRLL
jgi:uncharacterized protein YidB (DUF937 family)